MQNQIDIYSYEGLGYLPMVDFQSWRVALLNYDEAKFTRDHADDMERHHETDEVFVLLSGSCTLFVGGAGSAPANVSAVEMLPGKIYNIRKDVWHSLIGSEDMKLLIVENADTSLANSEHCYFSPSDLPG